jgi:hypothetical protein
MGTSPASRIVEISLEARILAKNDAMAARNRAWLAGLEILALNFVIATDEGLGASYKRLRDWAISAHRAELASEADGQRHKRQTPSTIIQQSCPCSRHRRKV